MLELIFQGFLEWAYGLILECWQYFSTALLDIMSMDFAYLKSHVPVIDEIMQLLMAVGWALLIGNLVFQALKSMAAGLGFEGEDPKLLFTRTFVFAFLLLASPQICEIGLGMTSKIIDLLQIPDAVNVTLVDESVFGSIGAAWLLVILFGIIVMFKVFKLLLEIAERYVILAMLTITAPLAFAMGGSKSTSEIFSGWCRMFGSMCLLMVTNVIFFKMLLSVLATVPSGLDVLPWIVLILTIVKVARKADAIVTRIGLNPAITGDSLGKVFPGALSYMVVRTAASQITKVIGKGAGSGGKGTSPNTPSGGSGGPRVTNPGGGRGGGTGAANYAQQASVWQNYSSRSQQTAPQQETIQNSLDPSNQQQTAAPQSTAVQSGGAQTITQKQTADAAAQGSFLKNRTSFAGARSRKTSVPPGVRRSMTYIKSEASSAVQAGMTGNLGSAGTPAASQNSTHSAETRYRRSDRSTRVVQTGSAGTVAASSIRMSQPYTQKGQGGAAGKGTQTAEHTGNATGQTAQSDSLGSAKKSPLTIQSGTGAPTGHGRQSGALSDPNQTRYTRRPPKAVTEPTAGAPPSVKRQTTVDVETSKPGAAGTAHAQQPLGETRPGRNGTPTGTASSTAAGRHSPIRQESRPTSVSGTPTIKGAGQHFGSAGTAIGGQQSPAMRQTTRKSPSAPALGEAQKQRTTSAPTVIKGGVGKKAASTPSRKQRWKHNDRSG